MSLVLVKVTRAIGLMGCFEKKGEPGWLGFLFVMCWIFSGGLVSILSSFLTKYQYNVNKNHPYNKYKWNYPTVWHLTVNIWELPPMEYIAKKKDDYFMNLLLYFHRLIKLCLYQKVRTTQISFVINFKKIRSRIYTVWIIAVDVNMIGAIVFIHAEDVALQSSWFHCLCPRPRGKGLWS